MPPPADYTEFSASEQKAITEEAESIIDKLEPFFPRIDDDLEYLKENENRIEELRTTIAKSRAEINELKRHAGQKKQEIRNKLHRLFDMLKLYSQNEKVIERCTYLLSSRFELFPEKSTDIYKDINKKVYKKAK